MEKMLAAFLKSMGISGDFIQAKMQELSSLVQRYDARMARIEANQLLIMRALNIPTAPENNQEKSPPPQLTN